MASQWRVLLMLLLLTFSVGGWADDRVDLVKNGDFSAGKLHWKLHRCFLVGNTVEFSNRQPDYIQLSQKLPHSLPAGRETVLEADVEVSDPYEVTSEKYQSQLLVKYYDVNGKNIWGKNPRGKTTMFTPTDGKKTFSFRSFVPAETAYMQVILNSHQPLQLKIHAVRLLVKLSPEERKSYKID